MAHAIKAAIAPAFGDWSKDQLLMPIEEIWIQITKLITNVESAFQANGCRCWQQNLPERHLAWWFSSNCRYGRRGEFLISGSTRSNEPEDPDLYFPVIFFHLSNVNVHSQFSLDNLRSLHGTGEQHDMSTGWCSHVEMVHETQHSHSAHSLPFYVSYWVSLKEGRLFQNILKPYHEVKQEENNLFFWLFSWENISKTPWTNGATFSLREIKNSPTSWFWNRKRLSGMVLAAVQSNFSTWVGSLEGENLTGGARSFKAEKITPAHGFGRCPSVLWWNTGTETNVHVR